MNLKHYAWVFKEALPSSVCDRIIKAALVPSKKIGKKEQALIESVSLGEKGEYRDLSKYPLTAEQKKELLKKRNANLIWLDEQWIFDLLHPFINTANKNAGWNFHWDWTESSQFVIYEKDQFYGWHTDSSASLGSNSKWKGSFNKTRKISSNIQLTDPSKYEGGLFQIDARMHDPDVDKPNIWTAPVERGTIICFPSFAWHQATPITKGLRYSMTHWHWGQPWK